jgi:hypothetical protein
MFTGALAASSYGTPRTTTDIDIVVKVERINARTELVLALKKARLQVTGKEIKAAFKSGYRIATFKDSKTPFTLDIMLSRKKLDKKVGTILGLQTFYQTAEDLILAKLRMIKVTVPRERTLKDEDDVKAILKFTDVNLNAIKKRAKRDSTLSILETIVTDASHQNTKQR